MNSVRRHRTKRRSGFKSYIVDSLEDYHERAVDVPEETKEETVSPFLLPDEMVVAEAKNVLKFTSLRSKKGVILGTLFVTNFKLTFVTSSLPVDAQENDLHNSCLQSDFLGLHDICLTEIDAIYYFTEADGSRKKKLTYSTSPPNKIKGLQIVLKSFRIVNFGFTLTESKEDIKITNALLVHRYPKRLDLFYLALDTPPPNYGVPNFILAHDWERELQRTKCLNWRVCKHNEKNEVFPSLPSSFVVPHCITDSRLANASNFFKGSRPPAWCWGTPRGAALVRMAQISPNITSSTSVENDLMKFIHKSHSQRVQPTIIDLDQLLPSLKSIQGSFVKLRELHTPDSLSAFNENEKSYLSRWQNSGWLSHVQMCLEVAQNAASAIAIRNSSVILQEGEGRDLSCLVSSLVQILLDPFARTFRGFHTLIQKEWVALGHPFCIRLGHLNPNSEELSPVWLLFLDCVHQLSLNHPSCLEFTSDYLVALWHGSHCSTHSTFMFDSVKECLITLQTLQDEGRSDYFYFWPVWCWWARREGLRSSLQKGTLDAQKDSLTRRQAEYKRRLSTVADEDSKEISLGQERRELLSEERNLRNEERSFRRRRQVREEAREKFVNVFYLQSLMETLMPLECLSRLADPVTIAHTTWHRLYYLMGKGGSSPLLYDPTLPLPPLEIPQEPLQMGRGGWRITPWTECFGYWVSDPDANNYSNRAGVEEEEPPEGDRRLRPCVGPCRRGLEEHWRIFKQCFDILDKFYSSSLQRVANGVSS